MTRPGSEDRSRTYDAPTRRSRGSSWRRSRGRLRCNPRAGGGRTPATRPKPCPSRAARSRRPRGAPNIQNRCCQSSGCPPCATSKKWVSNWRSIQRRKKSRLTAGTTRILAAEAVSVPQVSIGTRLIDIPGARSLRKVTTKLAAPDSRRYTEENHPERIEIHVHTGIILLLCVGNVVVPTIVRSRTHRKSHVDENAGSEINPIGERVEAREGHVARPDEQRPEIVGETRKNRQRVKEDHRHAMRGEELVVLLGCEQALFGTGELHPHDERFETSQRQEGECGDDVAYADLLVVHRRQEPRKTWRGRPDRIEMGCVRGGGGDDLRFASEFEIRHCGAHFRVSR